MSLCRAFVLSSAALMATGPCVAHPLSRPAARWNAHVARILGDPSLLRCYTLRSDGRGGVSTDDASASSEPLSYALTPVEGAPPERFQTAPGRWAGKGAVRLDRGVLSAAPCAKPGQPFTVELWFRRNGPGSLRGNDGATNGTLISEGNGYWDGWRVTTSYPEGTFGFEIGRPRPQSSAGLFGAGPLPDGAWHHLAATWNGREMRLYLNGLLAGAMPYSGTYTPGDRLRIGYADAGWGSVRLDVDTVAVYGRALAPSEVLRSAAYFADVGAEQADAISRGGKLLRSGKAREAALAFDAVGSAKGVDSEIAALARLGLADSLRQIGDGAKAARTLALVAGSGASDRLRLTALTRLLQTTENVGEVLSERAVKGLLALRGLSGSSRLALRISLARALLRNGQVTRGRSACEALTKDPAMDDETHLQLRLDVAHTLRGAGKHADARAEYLKLARLPAAGPSLRAYARLLALRTLVFERKLADAERGYGAILSDPNAPLSHRHEAREALRAIARARSAGPVSAQSASGARLPARPKPALEVHVARGGSDRNPGTQAEPLATLQGAVDAVRRICARGALPKGGIAVTFRAGVYPMSDNVRLDARDSGTAPAPVVYRAAPGARVEFRGGVRLATFARVTDPGLLARLPEAMRTRTVQVDLRKAGVADPGMLQPRGVGPEPKPVPELFWNGQALPLARWPNEGWAHTGRVSEEKNGEGGFTFEFDGDRSSRWALEKDAWLLGYFGWLWADSGVKLASVAPDAHLIRTAQASSYGAREGMPWFLYNVLSELDAPGEWFLDAAGGRLLLCPPSDPSKAVVEYSTLSKPFLTLEGASHVRFEGLSFELGRWNGIEIKGCEDVIVAGCALSKLRGTAVTIDGGVRCGVFGCELSELGRNGTWVRGGDRKTLTPAGHFVENCRIHHFSRWDRTYTPAAYVEGVGVRIAHNLIHDSPGHAMRIEGNDHVIEFNEVHHVVTETDDQGALDMWFNPTYRGVVIRHNFWHHIGGEGDDRMRAGVRLDDAICGVLIYGNVFWKASQGLFGGVQIHGGKENEVVNNVFVDCKYGVSFSGWGPERWKQYMATDPFLKATQQDVDIRQPPYSVRYPALARLHESPDVNRVSCNLVVNCGAFLTRDRDLQDTLDNVVTARDPGFVDMGSGDFRFRPDSKLLVQTGFRPIPFHQIGPYEHPLARAANPASTRPRRRSP